MTRLIGVAGFALFAASFAGASVNSTARHSSDVARAEARTLKSNASYSLRDVQEAARRRAETEPKVAKAGSARRSRKRGHRSCTTSVPSATHTTMDPTPVPSSTQQEPPMSTPSTTEPPPTSTTETPPSSATTETQRLPAPAAAFTSSNKRGVSADWNSPSLPGVVSNLRGPKFYAHYNWSPWRFDGLPGDIDFWPMLHGQHTIDSGDWNHVVGGYASTAMGCNEVNQAGQSVMDVGTGISIWQRYLSPLKAQGYRLVSHSTNQADDGIRWHQDFRSQCPQCESEIDMYSVHWYGTDAQAFKDYMTNFHNIFGKPLVVTEFAYTDWVNMSPNLNDVKNFMLDVMGWMDSQDFIAGYMWFGAWDNMPGGVPNADSLVDGGGNLKDLGNAYVYS